MNDATDIAYHNGEYKPLASVAISPLDRGFLFADSVYEVIPAYHGQLFRLAQHLQRLQASLEAIGLEPSVSVSTWTEVLNELVRRNGGGDLSVYLQVSRGAPAVRDHGFPAADTEPTLFAMASPLKPLPEAVLQQGINVITLEDIRWSLCYIKSTALLPNVLQRQQALNQGVADAILVRDGRITEATAANVFLVHDHTLLTPPRSTLILAGITRDLILELAVAHGIAWREEELPKALLSQASEVWLTSSTKEMIPVTRVDDQPIGDGRPGPVWRQFTALLQAYKDEARQSAMQAHE